MNLKTRKRISTLKQYRELESEVKEGFKGIIFTWGYDYSLVRYSVSAKTVYCGDFAAKAA